MRETQKPACYIPTADTDWLLQQKDSAVMQLFTECWCADPYGLQWVKLSTKLRGKAFTRAKKKLSDRGLFVFKLETSEQGSFSAWWTVQNLHGSKVKDFWGDTKLD